MGVMAILAQNSPNFPLNTLSIFKLLLKGKDEKNFLKPIFRALKQESLKTSARCFQI